MRKAKVKTSGFSKRGKKTFKTVEDLPTVDGISEKLMRKIHESLLSHKAGLKRYNEVKDSPKDLQIFCSMYRNPLHDTTGTNFFSTGLKSSRAMKCLTCETVKDHFIQRTKALRYIFRELNKDPEMSILDFIDLMVKYASTVRLTKDEHKLVNLASKKYPKFTNVKLYKKLGIKVPGLGDWCKKNYVTRVIERSF